MSDRLVKAYETIKPALDRTGQPQQAVVDGAIVTFSIIGERDDEPIYRAHIKPRT